MKHAHAGRHGFKTWGLALALSLVGTSGMGTFAADQVSKAGASDSKSGGIRQGMLRSFDQLSDDQPVVRDSARRRLMQLSRKELSTLREIVKARLPLLPSEADSLHEIVTQAYLSDDSYPTETTHGFLGVIWPDWDMAQLDCGGVEIRYRVPGFCAYRCFEDGDVVLAIGEPQDEQELHDSRQMTAAVQSYPAGQRVLFKVLRRGRLIRVPVVLDARPLGLTAASMVVDFSAVRNEEAEAYWEENFQALVYDPT